MIVYLATHRTTGLIYVGATRLHLEVRKYSHSFDAKKRCDRPFTRALREVGVEGFDWRVLESFGDPDSMFTAERAWVARLDAANPLVGYNLLSGGRGGGRASPRGRVAQAESNRRRGRNWKKTLTSAQRAAIAKATRNLGPRGAGIKINAADKAALRKLRAIGLSYGRIGKALNVSLSTVRNHLRGRPKDKRRAKTEGDRPSSLLNGD